MLSVVGSSNKMVKKEWSCCLHYYKTMISIITVSEKWSLKGQDSFKQLSYCTYIASYIYAS